MPESWLPPRSSLVSFTRAPRAAGIDPAEEEIRKQTEIGTKDFQTAVHDDMYEVMRTCSILKPGVRFSILS